MVSASASAKTILFGEHAVVYGEPAIAVPLSGIRTTAEVQPNGKAFRVISGKTDLDSLYSKLAPDSAMKRLLDQVRQELGISELPPVTLTIRSDIPIASGLGSGAALSAAIIRALFRYHGREEDPETVNRLAFEVEKIYHGNPSGVDNTTIVYEQPVFFIKGQGFAPLQADLSGLHLLVIDTGIRSTTADVVNDVREHYAENRDAIEAIGALVREARGALEAGDPAEIGRLMNENL